LEEYSQYRPGALMSAVASRCALPCRTARRRPGSGEENLGASHPGCVAATPGVSLWVLWVLFHTKRHPGRLLAGRCRAGMAPCSQELGRSGAVCVLLQICLCSQACSGSAGWKETSAMLLLPGRAPGSAVLGSVRPPALPPPGGPICSAGSSAGLPSSRKMRSYWRESSGGLRG